MLLLLACTWISPEELEDRLDLDRDGLGWPEDCDDADASVQRTRSWYLDVDGDGYGSEEQQACEAPGSAWVLLGGDCDDDDDAVLPGAAESCNEVDDDCDGVVDDAPVSTWYEDQDSDGWGDRRDDSACPAEGWVSQGGDCDDEDPAVHPEVEELCNGLDDDCNGSVDDAVCAPVGALGLEDFARWEEEPGWGASVAVTEGLDGVAWGAGGADRVVLSDGQVLTGGSGFGADLGAIPGQLLVLAEGGELLAFEQGVAEANFGADLQSVDTWQAHVAVGDPEASTVWLLEGPLSGAVSALDSFSAAGADESGFDVGLGDLDGDGTPELVAGAPGRKNGKGSASVYGDSGELTRIDGPTGSGLGHTVQCADLDGDGQEDLVLGAAPGAAAWLFMSPLGASTTDDAQAWIVGPEGSELGSALALPDLDGDGNTDLVVGAPEAGSTWIAYGPQTGALTWQATLDAPVEQGSGRALAGGDLDEDGFDDLLLGLPGAGAVVLVPGGERP